jgi:hypothetical protein
MGDIGFERTGNGFKMHADDYDWGHHGNRFQLNKLNQKYAENKLVKYVKSTTKYNILSKKVNEDGKIKIVINVR